MSGRAYLERDGDIGFVVLDNPPVNAGSLQVRRDILAAVEEIERDPGLIGGVLIGANGIFVAGSDISEFGRPIEAPELPQVITAIEQGNKPFVAAISGAALGGGYELSLGCDARIASPEAVVGLPEVTLGMIPGAGGTQRLPRLTGISRALALICEGRRVKAGEAASIGMIDAVTTGALRQDAAALLRSLGGVKRRIRDMGVPPESSDVIDAAASKALTRARGRPPAAAAIEAVLASRNIPVDTALANERAVFTRLRTGPEAAALRYLFFAERKAGRLPADRRPTPISRAGVVGAGTMGIGIAAALLMADIHVTLVDSSSAALDRARAAIADIIARWRAAQPDGGVSWTFQDRLGTGAESASLAGCDLVIEAIIEEETAKRSLLMALETVVSEQALIASNTSYLDLETLAAGLSRPGNFLGLHFFNPANRMTLVEVGRSTSTATETMAAGVALVRKMAKQPVIVRSGRGFVGNRIYAAYRRQCEFMLEDGCRPEQIDAALEAFGFALGPFATSDLSGLDIAWAMRKAEAPVRDGGHRYVDIPDRLCEAGRLGRKTGAGWYDYDAGGKGRSPSAAVRQIIDAESARKGIMRRSFDDSDIVLRVLATIANEAALLVEEGIAERATDVDVVFTHGFGFPRHLGGPLYWASRVDPDRLETAMEAAAQAAGASFRRGSTAPLFDMIREVSR